MELRGWNGRPVCPYCEAADRVQLRYLEGHYRCLTCKSDFTVRTGTVMERSRGPLADDTGEMVGAWGGAGKDRDIITLRQALAERAQQLGDILLSARGTEMYDTSQAGFPEAVQAAGAADVVILALGESSSMSGEGGSRARLDLPGNQQQLLEAVVATGKPVVLLIFSGRLLVLDWASKHVAAILAVWFPGTEAGIAATC